MKSLKKRILLACLFCAFIPTLLSILLFTNVFSRILDTNSTTELLETIDVVYNELSLAINDYNDISLKIAESPIIKKSLDDNKIERNEQFIELYNLSQGLRAGASFSVFNDEGDYLYGTSSTYEQTHLPINLGVLRKTKCANGKIVSYVIPRSIEKTIDVSIQFGRAIFQGEELVGFILINLSNSNLERLVEPYVYQGSNIVIINKFDEVLYITPSFDNYKDYISHNYYKDNLYASEDNKYLYAHKDILSEFEIIYVHPSGITDTIKNAMNFTSLIIIITSIPLILFLATKLSKQVAKPINEIVTGMEAISHGNYSMTLPSSEYTEIAVMSDNYNKMAAEIDFYTSLLKKQKEELDEARVSQLQAQFNPHFVYNTLDTIKWLAREHGIKEISQTTENLSILLRTSIRQNQIIELRNEISILGSYIEIQKIRFDDRYSYDINIDPKYINILIPKLILQSLVENAITYGFSDGRNGTISVSAYEKDADFFITVADDGVGISEDVQQVLFKTTNFNNGSGTISHHTGLYNANHIIQMYYGEGYGLKIESSNSTGTKIIIKIKLERDIKNVENPSS